MRNQTSFLIVLVTIFWSTRAYHQNGFIRGDTCSSRTLLDCVDKRKNADLYTELQQNVDVGKGQEALSGIAHPLSSTPSSTTFPKSGKKSFPPVVLQKPELLAPAGGWPQMKAAVANGCNAVYFGLQEGFNARARAHNFAIDDVANVMQYLKDYGVKGYCVVNILVFEEELDNLVPLIKQLAAAGVDALIMQDVGSAAFVRQIAPNLPVHASTQMSITDPHGARFSERLGIDRVVVGRELNFKEIHAVSTENQNTEVEAFVHGALCVSYSGQCFSSESWGGRSANRGQCAQACRLPYGLIVNGDLQDLQDVEYLLSPQDLQGLDYVPQLIRSGVRSFKIEGRLKGENYVALTTKAYRLAIDEAWAVIQAEEANKVDGFVEKIEYKGPSHELRNDLRQVFSRGQDSEFQGLSAGFLEGVRHQNIVRGRNPRHRGLLIGSVKGKNKKGVLVELQNSIKRGDGVVFDQGRPEEHEEGGSVFTICDSKGNDLIDSGEISEKGQVLLTFGKNSINFKNIEVGDLVWKNKDPALDRRLKAEVSSSSMQLVPISVSIKASLGEPLSITMTSIPYNDGDPVFSVTTKSNNVIDKAQKVPINKEQLKKAIGTFGNTPYFSTSIDFSGFAEDDNLFLPIHDIKDTRRRAVEELIEKRRVFNQGNDIASTDVENISKIKHSLKKDALATSLSSSQKTPHSPLSEYIEEEEEDLPGKEEVHLSLLCRSPHQVDAALNIPEVQEIVLDFLEIHGLREYVAKVKAVGKRVVVATPRIIKPDEEKLYIFFVRLRADAILVRSSGFLQQLADLGGSGSFVEKFNSTIPEIYGDFSLNTANSLSASIFLGAGLARLTPTHDLNSEQIVDMVAGLEKIEKESSVALKSKIEVIVHQHMPIFHTEHCVFCRFLSNGNNFTDCGHPCESNDVHLRSMEDGSDHLVLADQGCRNTVFNAKAQSGASYISEFIKAGICNFRIELVDEPAHVIESLVKGYMDVLQGQPNSKDRLQRLLDDKVPNGYGRMQGASVGSLLPKKETPRNKLKKTAR